MNRPFFLLLFLVAFRLLGAVPESQMGTVVQWATSEVTTDPIPSLTNIIQLDSGTTSSQWSVAVRSNHQMVVFGAGNSGQYVGLDDSTTNDIFCAAAGWYDGVAIKMDGSLVHWGNHLTNANNVWTNPPTVTNACALAMGDHYAAALLSNGVVRVWGNGAWPGTEAGDGVFTNIMALDGTWYYFTVLHSNGTVSTFGQSAHTPPAAATNGWKIACGRHFNLLLRSNGTVVAWGENTYGQTNVPADLTNVVAVAGGYDHSLAVKSDGTLVSWGGSQVWMTNDPPASVTNLYSVAAWSANLVLKNGQEYGEAEPPDTVGSTYYVAKSGNDSNPGTLDEPFLTVQKAVDTATNGCTVLVATGTYAENVTSERSGTVAPIILDGQGVATMRSIYLNHSNIVVQNWSINGLMTSFQSAIWMGRGANYCVLSNNVIDNAYHTNVYLLTWVGPDALPFGTAGSHNLVISNTLLHAVASPVLSLHGDNNTIQGNRLLDADTVDWFNVWGRSNHIVGNLCSNAFESGSFGGHPDFLQTFGDNGVGAQWITVEGNTVINNSSLSMQLCMMTSDDVPEISDWVFRNNIFVGVPRNGSVTLRNVSWYNNLFIDCATNSESAVMYFGSLTNGTTVTNFVASSAHGSTMFNNIFLNCGDYRTNNGWYYFYTYLTNVSADYNYVAKTNYTTVKQDELMRMVGDAGGWDPSEWWEDHGINGGDPSLNGDYTVPTNSILVAGTNLSALFTTDMLGETRPASGVWTMGPYEANGGEEPPDPPAASGGHGSTMGGRLVRSVRTE